MNQPSIDSFQFPPSIARKRTTATQNKNTAEYLIKCINIHHFGILKSLTLLMVFVGYLYSNLAKHIFKCKSQRRIINVK